MNRLAEYRNAYLVELRRLLNDSPGLDPLDYALDSLLRGAKDLPERPEGRLPYAGLFVLPKLPESLLPGFQGDLSWVHSREGHAGRPYWPGGQSGLTLDPGFDLGYQTSSALHRYYGPYLEPFQLEALEPWLGRPGARAAKAPQLPVIRDIRISYSQADTLFPVIAEPYWRKIAKRFDNLVNAPPSVQTVLLSLAFNRGPHNPQLHVLKKPIKEGKWLEVATLVSLMQQTHPLHGIRRRRQLEAQLIEREILT